MQLSELTKLPINGKVGVIGGGVSGLFFAYFLNKLRPDVYITLIDQNHGRYGGWINSWATEDRQGKPVLLERGPRTLRGASDGTVLIIDTLRQLGQADKVKCIDTAAPANKKFLVGPDNKLVQVPDSWSTFCKFYLNPISNGITGSLLLEGIRPKKNNNDDETVEQLLNRRFGKDDIGNNIMSAIYHGIYADDISTLSAKKVSSKLLNDEQKYGSSLKAALVKWWKSIGSNKFSSQELSAVLQQYQHNFHGNTADLSTLSRRLKNYPMLSFNGGLSTVPNTIMNKLKDNPKISIVNEKATKLEYPGNKLQLELSNGNVITRKEFDHVRFAATPNYINKILRDKTTDNLRNEFEKIRYNTVILINYYLPGKDVIGEKHHSFGYLVPKSNPNPEKLLGVIFDSVIEQSAKSFFSLPTQQNNPDISQPYTKLTAMLGGHLLNNSSGVPVIPDESSAITQVKKAFIKHLAISDGDLDAGLWVYTVAKDCLPRFNVGYTDLVGSIERQIIKQYKGNVSLGGMGFSRGPGVPDVVTDAMMDAIKLK